MDAGLPDGFRELRRGRVRLWVEAGLAEAATGLGLLEPDAVARLVAARAGAPGRGATALAALPGHGERLHLRPLRHGGWLGGLLGELFWGLGRPAAELRVNAALSAAGLPVARPALVVGRRRAGPLWSAAYGTLAEEDSVDGIRFLAAAPGPERVLRAVEALARALRGLHDAGALHADLHLGNLLVRERGADTEVVVVDLDGARLTAPLHPARRMQQLMRLYRSLRKRGLLERVGARGLARFLGHYTTGDRELRRALLRHLPRARGRGCPIAFSRVQPTRRSQKGN